MFGVYPPAFGQKKCAEARMNDPKKVLAVVTGAVSIGLALAYLIVVQILDSRGPMLPAPIEMIRIPSFF
jgi:hypothetical protein